MASRAVWKGPRISSTRGRGSRPARKDFASSTYESSPSRNCVGSNFFSSSRKSLISASISAMRVSGMRFEISSAARARPWVTVSPTEAGIWNCWAADMTGERTSSRSMPSMALMSCSMAGRRDSGSGSADSSSSAVCRSSVSAPITESAASLIPRPSTASLIPSMTCRKDFRASRTFSRTVLAPAATVSIPPFTVSSESRIVSSTPL
ncbi:MAG: hypothetical protein A4E73_01429 [Syntrophaceae bacterium PtaU1.Bin231]|nr:MAG: hypothetical protein A4E73_01429 [Syntrophaceae bacterium PtaU1.Bin231]